MLFGIRIFVLPKTSRNAYFFLFRYSVQNLSNSVDFRIDKLKWSALYLHLCFRQCFQSKSRGAFSLLPYEKSRILIGVDYGDFLPENAASGPKPSQVRKAFSP